jgi:hypothetical protein
MSAQHGHYAGNVRALPAPRARALRARQTAIAATLPAVRYGSPFEADVRRTTLIRVLAAIGLIVGALLAARESGRDA